jgi:hypothetical protein
MKNFLLKLSILIITLLLINYNFDYFASIIPGWNTTINSGRKITFILLIIVFVFSLLIMILINVISKILKMLIHKK